MKVSMIVGKPGDNVHVVMGWEKRADVRFVWTITTTSRGAALVIANASAHELYPDGDWEFCTETHPLDDAFAWNRRVRSASGGRSATTTPQLEPV